MAPRKMLTKPVEKKLREDMQQAIDQNRMALNEGQTIDDVIEHIRQGIKSDTYQPGLSFEDFYTSLVGAPQATEPEASPGGDAEAPAKDTDIEDLSDWFDLYVKAKAKIDEATEMANLAKKRITERLEETGAEVAKIHGKAVATWTTVNQRQFQKKKFAEEYPDLVEQFTTVSSHKRFDLK